MLQNLGTQTVAEGPMLTVNLAASDADGDPLTYTVANAPSGSTFDAAHGILTWTPNLFQAGTYADVVFGASDGSKTVFQTITIDVTQTDQPPVLLPVNTQTGRENAPVQFTLAATSVDNDPITYSATTPLPSGAHLNAQTGEFSLDTGLHPGRQLLGDLRRLSSQRSERHHHRDHPGCAGVPHAHHPGSRRVGPGGRSTELQREHR